MKHEAFEEFYQEKEPIRGPYKLINGWKWLKVKRISEKPQYGYSTPAKHNSVGPKMLRISDIQDGNVNWNSVPFCIINKQEAEKYKLEEGDILFARTGATTGKTYLIKDCPEAIFASYLIRLKIDKSKASPEYVYLFFQSPHYWMQIKPRGGAQPNMNAKILSKLLIPIPSILEQNRIVARIKELFNKIDEIKKLRKETLIKTEQILQSSLHKFLGNEERRDWIAKPLGDLCRLINGKAFKPKDWSEKGLPIIRIQNLNDPTKPYNYNHGTIEDKFIVNKGDVLISWSGTPGTSFGAHIWKGGKSILNQHIFRVELIKNIVTKSFFVYSINFILHELIEKAHGGVGLSHITKKKLESTKILIPGKNGEPDIDKQKSIVGYLDKIREKANTIQRFQKKTEKEIELLRESILHKAFRGNLLK